LRQFAVGGLSDDQFARWKEQAAVGELEQLLRWTWRGDLSHRRFPDRYSDCRNDAERILAGLRAGVGRSGLVWRIRANAPPRTFGLLAPVTSARRGAAFSGPGLHALYGRIARWVPRSIAEWQRADQAKTLRDLPFQMHLSKYDPQYSVAGHYDDGTWTDFGDVGRSFREGVLTLARYEQVESAHIDVLLEACRESGVQELVPWRFDGEYRRATAERTPVAASALGAEMRRMLRGETVRWIWCDPELRLYVARGFDYHLWVGSHVACPGAVELARAGELFPEVGLSSPHLQED
jgi:hypothetical protein